MPRGPCLLWMKRYPEGHDVKDAQRATENVVCWWLLCVDDCDWNKKLPLKWWRILVKDSAHWFSCISCPAPQYMPKNCYWMYLIWLAINFICLIRFIYSTQQLNGAKHIWLMLIAIRVNTSHWALLRMRSHLDSICCEPRLPPDYLIGSTDSSLPSCSPTW